MVFSEGCKDMTEQENQSTPVVATDAPTTSDVAPTPYTDAPSAPIAEKRNNKAALRDLAAGQVLTGKVKSITPYGAFIDINVNRDGLVHISELSDTRVEKVEDVIQVGQEVTVRILEIDNGKNRISLTMRTQERQARPERRRRQEVNQDAITALNAGDIVEGMVKSITPIGAFVDIGVGKDGLVHISELSDTRVAKVEDAVQIGQGYTFKIIEIDAEHGRISLSLRQASRSQQLSTITKDQVVSGKVSGHSPFGVFVNIGVGRDGLVHTSELPDGEKPEVGSELTVRVLEVDNVKNRISLTAFLEGRPEREERPTREERPARSDSRPARSDSRPARSSEGRPPREGGRPPREGGRPPRDNRPAETYTSSSFNDETFVGDATMDDLMSRFGGAYREKRQRETDTQYEDGQRKGRLGEVIRRTLGSDDE